MSLRIRHNGGFFSCCSGRLHHIIKFINLHKKLPNIVDSSEQFKLYKKNNDKKDITFHFFKDYNEINLNKIINKIDYCET